MQSGNKEDILEFLRNCNLLKREKGYNEQDMLWMLKDKDFYEKVMAIMRERKIYSERIWGYGFLHNDEAAVKDFMYRSSHLQTP